MATIVPKRLTEISPQLRRTFERARDAVTMRNYKYAFEMLRGVLRAEPGCFEVRAVLRQGQLERVKDKSKFMRRLAALPSVILGVYIKGPGLVKKGMYAEALDVAESAMTADPTFLPTINFVADVADTAKLYPIAVHVLDIGMRYNEGHIGVIRRLSKLYGKLGEENRAVELLQEICRIRPNDMAAANELKQATALVAMKQGKWDQAGSYKDVVKDTDEQKRHEEQERFDVRDTDALASRLADAKKALADEESVTNHRRLAELYQKAREWEEALEHYNRVVEMMGALDPVIDQAITQVHCERFDDAIRQWQEAAQSDPSQRERAQAAIDQIHAQKEELVYQRIRERAQRYPNEAEYRYDLGMEFWKRDLIDEAIKEFQVALRSPRYKKRCQIYLARCMYAKGMTELAEEQFVTAMKDIAGMTAEKKEIMYDLAQIYEHAGRNDEALKLLKDIYAADVGYRDVGKRIQAFYTKD